jgi:hypothetical protein
MSALHIPHKHIHTQLTTTGAKFAQGEGDAASVSSVVDKLKVILRGT